MKEKLLFFLLVMLMTTSLSAFHYHIFSENGKQGLKDGENNIVIPAQYEKLGWSEGDFKVVGQTLGFKENGNWGLINLKNEKIQDAQFTDVSIHNTAPYILAAKFVQGAKSKLFGLLNSHGKVIVGFNYVKLIIDYEKIIAWKSGVANIPRAGMIDFNEKVIIPFNYINIQKLGSLRYLAERPDTQKELLNDSGVRVASFFLDSISTFQNGLASFWKDHLQGIMNSEGKIVVRPEFKNIQYIDEHFEVQRYPQWELRTTSGEAKFTLNFDGLWRVNDSTFKVKTNDLFWLADQNGKKVSPNVYNNIGDFYKGHAICEKNGNYGIVREDGTELIPARQKNIYHNQQFFYVVNRYNKWTIFDKYLVQKTKREYDSIGGYQKTFFPVKKGEYWGMMNLQGEEVLNCVFDSLGSITSNLLEVKFHGQYGIVDTEGNWVVPPSPYDKTIVNDYIYIETEETQSRVYDLDRRLIYFTDNQLEIHDDYFLERLTTGNVWRISFSGVIKSDKLTNIVYRDHFNYSEFEEILPPSEGYLAIKKDGKYGFIDEMNRLRIANRYDSVHSFYDGYAAIKLIGKWGFIDKEENLIIQPMYEWVGNFSNGICLVKIKGKYDIINKENELVFKSGFDEMEHTYKDRYRILANNQQGLVNSNGQVLVNYVFDEIIDLGNDYVLIEKMGKKGVVNLNGLYVIPRSYDEIRYDEKEDSFLVKKDLGYTDYRFEN